MDLFALAYVLVMIGVGVATDCSFARAALWPLWLARALAAETWAIVRRG